MGNEGVWMLEVGLACGQVEQVLVSCCKNCLPEGYSGVWFWSG